MSFSSQHAANIEMTLRPPTEFSWNRRYVFLVDMSYSMVSGPCPFDIDVTESTHGFSGAYKDFDPNFPSQSNFADARGRVADCSVDESLNFGKMKLDYSQPQNSAYIPDHKTFKGNDWDGNRFKVVRQWISQMRNSNNLEFINRTQILIVPATSGLAYDRLLKDYPLKDAKFVNLTDPQLDAGLTYLETIHNETVERALTPSDQRFNQLDPDLDTLKMGTTSLTLAYDRVFTSVDKDMETLAQKGDLTHTTYKLATLGDTRINPLDEQYDKALQLFGNSCLNCLESLEIGWGKKENNSLEAVDLKLSLIQGLNKYYGSGFIDTDFIKIESLPIPQVIQYQANTGNTTFSGTEFPNNQRDAIQFLDLKSKERNASSRVYLLNSDIPPYRIANNNSGITTYKTTHVFLLNANFKIDANGGAHLDSDGDGLTDDLENQFNLNPQIARTNALCLDSLMTEEAYKSRCESLFQAKLCNALLDSDGDSLNECEEVTIGTDPFDFDTDGDGVPDSVEILYSMNPLVDDSKVDSNGDGLTNIMNLGKGFNPSVSPSQVHANDTITILLNFISQQKMHTDNVGDVKTDLFQLELLSFPLKPSFITVQPQAALYLLRPGSKGFNPAAKIPLLQQLIKPIGSKFTNKLMGLIRVVDPDEPQRVYWEQFELELDAREALKITNIDLSKFSQMKVIDRVRASK